MGRKIPGKKHRGVKDPEKQRAKRLSELEGKINAPPKNVDDQAIPKSLERLIKLKNAAKNNALVQKKKKKKKKGTKLIQLGPEQNFKSENIKGKPEKIVPIFNQRPGESVYQFWNRVNRETHHFMKETEFETKFNVEVKRNSETGEVEGLVKKPKDEFDKIERVNAKHRNIKKKKKVIDSDNPKLSKSQKRKEKLLKKKQKKSEENENELKFNKVDKVEFGEIVHAPPELKVLPRNVEKSLHKVKTNSLLLNSLLKKSSNNDDAKTIDRTKKRKNLPIGERRQLEKQQSDVIAMYRELKARKLGDSSVSA